MDEKKINSQIRNARIYYKKKKYKKALSIIENISESDKSILNAAELTDFTLLQCLIYAKLNRYYECFHYILPLFVKIPHQPELNAKTKEIFSREGIHRVIYVNLRNISSKKQFFLVSSEKQTTFLNLIQNIKDAPEKGRCLMIFFLSVTKNYAYLDYLAEELRKFFPTNNFLRAEIKKKEKFQEDTVRLKKEQEDIERIKEKELARELDNVDEYIKAENYRELKDKLEDIIREAKKHNLNYLTMKAQDVYNQYKKNFPPEVKPEKRVKQEPFPTQKPDDKASLEAKMRRSPAIREFMEELGFPTFHKDPTKEEIDSRLVEEGESEMWLQKYEKDLKLNPDSKEAWFGKAYVLKVVGRVEEAIQAYDEVLKIEPDYKEMWYNKAIALEELGRSEEAIQAYDKALGLDPRYKEALYNKGNTLGELDRLEEALQTFEKFLESNPQLKEGWVNKGIILKRLGRFEEALQAYDKALELDPQMKVAWNNKGSVFEQLDQFAEALRAYDKALELDPNYKRADYGKKAVLQKQQQQQNEKEKKTTKNKKFNLKQRDKKKKTKKLKGPIDIALDLTGIMDDQYEKGIEYLNNNRFDMAIIEFKKSLKRDKDLSYVKYEQIGHCYSGKQEYLEAVKYYEMSLKAYPPSNPSQGSTLLSYNLLYNKALALKKIGRYDDAITDLNEALRQEPRFSNAWILKSNCYGSKGESEEAIKYLDKALEVEPRNLLAWKIKASYLVDNGNEKKAQEMLNKLLTMEPIDFQSWCIKGEIFIKSGNIGEARTCFNKALTLSEGHPYVHQYINKYKHLLNEKL